MFAWEAYEKGVDVHLQADPTKLALLSSEYKKKKENYKKDLKGSIVDKYGGQEHLEAPPKELLLAQTVGTSVRIRIFVYSIHINNLHQHSICSHLYLSNL